MQIDTRVMDGQLLDLPDEHFDLSFSTFGLMFFPDWRKGVAELARVTRDGGRAGITVLERHYGAGTIRPIARRLETNLPGKGRNGNS